MLEYPCVVRAYRRYGRESDDGAGRPSDGGAREVAVAGEEGDPDGVGARQAGASDWMSDDCVTALAKCVCQPCVCLAVKTRSGWRCLRELCVEVNRRAVEQVSRGVSLPPVAFYRSMWRNNRYLFVKTILVNYVLQVVMECLPWWACRRKVNYKMDAAKIKLSHRLVTGKSLSWGLLLEYLQCASWYSLLESLSRFVKNRVTVENQLEARRLVLERLLYAEWLELEKLLRHGNLEEKIVQDVASMLKVVNHYLPSLMSNVYTIVGEMGTLWVKRGLIDWLAVAYPLCIVLCRDWSKRVQELWDSKLVRERREQNREALNAAIAQVLGGIVDIQANNLQSQLLTQFDRIARLEVSSLKTWLAWVMDVLHIHSDLGISSFVFELICFHALMRRSGRDHGQQSRIQHHIDQVVYGTKKSIKYVRKLRSIARARNDLVQLLRIPTFVESPLAYKLPTHTKLACVRVSSDLAFRYSAGSPNAVQLGCELCFKAGRTYIMIGQNTSGKSTLAKLLAKFIHPTQGTVSWNDISYEHVSHVQLRDWISYIPQQPLMINGTIRDNILIGNFRASEQDVLQAAEASGLLDFLRSAKDKVSLGGDQGDDDESGDVRASQQQDSTVDGGYCLESNSIGGGRRDLTGKEDNLTVTLSIHHDDVSFANPCPAALPISPGYNSGANFSRVPSFTADSSSFASSRRPPLVRSNSVPDLHAPSFIEGNDSAERRGHETILPHSSLSSFFGLTTSPTSFSTTSLSGLFNSPSVNNGSETPALDRLLAHEWAPRDLTSELSAKLSPSSEEASSLLDQPLEDCASDINNGLKQSVALARVFVKKQARFIILDDATSHMDPFKLKTIVFPRLFDFVRRSNMCLLVITHNLLAIQEFDQTIVLHEGKVIYTGTHHGFVSQNVSLGSSTIPEP